MIEKIYPALPTPIKAVAKHLYPYRHYKFFKIAQECNGMMSKSVYSELYKYSSNIVEGNVLEIGSAHGAGAISLALGIKESGGSANVIAIEKGGGEFLSRYGTKKDNISLLKQNVRQYGVGDYVEVVDQQLSLDEGVPSDIESQAPFSLLCLDADGRLNRDFKLLYDHLLSGSIVVIDDYNMPHRGKPYRTVMYSNLLCENGYLNKYKIIDKTLVAIKPPEPPDISNLDFSAVNELCNDIG